MESILNNRGRLSTYRAARYHGMKPAAALAKAREGAAPVAYYVGAYPDSSKLGAPMPCGGRRSERPESVGLRLVGEASDILGGRAPRGYYVDSCQSETARGAVYQLPGRKGRAIYIPAILDPYNNGPAILYLSRATHGEKLESSWDDDSDAKREAALAADSEAESYAESAREYDEAWQAGRRWLESRDDSAALRREALAILKERKAAARLAPEWPALCATIRNRLESILAALESAMDERREMWAGCPSRLESAFLDGAELSAAPY